MPTLNGTNSAGAERFEASDVVFDVNLFNGSAYGNPAEQKVDITIPVKNEGSICGQAIVDGTCTFTFTGDRNAFPANDDFRVLSYPRGFLGSMGGRYCTAGFLCGAFEGAGILQGRRVQGTALESPVFDLRIPQANIGLPARLDEINSLVLTASANHCAGTKPYANYFVDAYIYDTTQNPPLPQYSGTVNGINDQFNRMWNTNVWFAHPNQDAMWAARQAGDFALENALIRQFTGGEVVRSDFQLEAGGDVYKMVFKHEMPRNNFFYVGFVRVEMADGTKPTPNTFQLEYRSIVDYLLTDSFWNLVQSEGQDIIAAMAQGSPSLTVVRPNSNMFIDGVAIGNESFGQPGSDSGTICWDEMRWDLNGQTYGGKSNRCQLPFRIGPSSVDTRCRLPLNIFGNFDCRLPLSVVGGRLRGPTATCDDCPAATSLPKLSVPYGSSAVISPGGYFDFPEFSVVEILQAQIISGNLEGELQFDPSLDLFNAFYTPPNDTTICDTQCGKIRLSYRFQCADGEPHTCTLDCLVCSFPDASHNLSDETVFMTGSTIKLAVAQPVDLSQPICPPITQPPVGRFLWAGDGWLFESPDNWWGTFDVMLPVFANGDKAHEQLRCVTICKQGPIFIESSPSCRTMVFIRDKALSGDRWIAAVKIRSLNLTINSISSGEYTDYETCEKVVLNQLRQEWNGNISGQFLCGDRRIYVGRDVDIRIDKDVTDPDTARFYGKARVDALTTNFQYQRNQSDDQQVSYTLRGHGNFYAERWAY